MLAKRTAMRLHQGYQTVGILSIKTYGTSNLEVSGNHYVHVVIYGLCTVKELLNVAVHVILSYPPSPYLDKQGNTSIMLLFFKNSGLKQNVTTSIT